jgi:hypothetical protein
MGSRRGSTDVGVATGVRPEVLAADVEVAERPRAGFFVY